MDIDSAVINSLNKLDKNWYQQKRKQFIKNPHYDEKKDRIVYPSEYYLDEDENGFPISEYCEVEVDFIEYSWDFFAQKNQFPISSIFIAFEIVDSLRTNVCQVLRPKDAIDLIREVFRCISDEIKTIKSNTKGLDEYHSCVNYFYKQLVAYTESNLSSVKIAASIEVPDSTLDFNINQEELAALIAILIQCDILTNDPQSNDKLKIHAFIKIYFRYFNLKSKKHQLPLNFSKKYSENQDSLSHPFQSIKKKLLKVLNSK